MAENRILNNNLQVKGVSQMWSGGGSHYYYFERNNELNVYTAAGDSSTMYLNFRGGDINFANTKAIIKSDTGNFGINVSAPSYKLDVGGDIRANQGRIIVKRGTGLTHAEWEDDSSANGRAQLILDSHYSDLIIASRNANSNKHGSTLTFATQSTSTNDVAKWVIGQGQYQEGANHLAFAYGVNQTNPHSILGTDNAYADFVIMDGGKVVIGGTVEKNAHSATSSTRLMFGGANSDAESNYYIGTNMEDYGGNYTKLDLRWHTGIRMGAQPSYGGIRFYDSEDLGTVIMSIGETDANVRISNTLLIGSTAYIAPVGQSMDLRKVNSISFAPNNGWNDPTVHGIMSTNSSGTASDNISINSYNDITLRLDANNNNAGSYLRVYNDSAGSGGELPFWTGANNNINKTRIHGYLGINAEPNESGYVVNMGGSIDMNNASIDYLNQIHFQDNVRFYDEGNDSYLNFKYGDASTGAIRFRKGDGAQTGMLYSDSNGFGLLSADGSWSVRTQNSETRIYHNAYFEGNIYGYTYYDRNDTNYYLDPSGYSKIRKLDIVAAGSAWNDGLNLYSSDGSNEWNLLVDNGNADNLRFAYNNAERIRFETGGNIRTFGNTYLGDSNGDQTHINDTLYLGATDSGDAHMYFGENSSNWYGLYLNWDSGYRVNWYSRNAGTNTRFMYFDTNDTVYLNWERHFNMNNREINYVSQLHFYDNVRFYDDGNDSTLNFKYGDANWGRIAFRNGSNIVKGYLYSDNAGFGLTNSNGNWSVRTTGSLTALAHNGTEVLSTTANGVYVSGTTAGEDVLAVDGVNGRLFTVTDSLDDSLFSVNTIAGLPVMEAFADQSIKLGPFTAPVEVTSTGELKVDGGTDLGTAVTGASVSNDTITFTRANGGTFSVTTSDANTNYYLDNITKSGNTLTYVMNGKTDVTYEFGSAAFAATGDFATAAQGTLADSALQSLPAHNHDGRYMRMDQDTHTTGGIEIRGSLSRGTYASASNYKTGADNIVLKGNSVGRSGIFFESEKDGTNINHSSDFGFIQYHAYGTGTSGESNELIIGVSNDADDHVVLNAPNVNGLKFRTGVSTADYTIWHSGNDGSGSGLDADTLDGLHASHFAAAGALSGYATTGHNHVGTYLRNSQHIGSSHYSNYLETSTTISNQSTTAKWYKVIDMDAGGPTRIRLRVVTDGNNTQSNDEFFIAGSGYNMQTSILKLPSTSYNTSKLTAVKIINPGNAVNQEVWIKVAGMDTTLAGNIIVYSNVALSTSAGQSTEPTGNTGDSILNIGSNSRGSYALMSSSGAYFGRDVTTFRGRLLATGDEGSGNGLDADLVDGLHASSFFRADTGNSADARIAAGDGRGLRFWDSDNYKIYMSDVNNGTWGGRVGGETTSDYNMYFKMSGGTNRGFIFRNGTNNLASIDGAGNGRFEGDVVAYSASDKRLKDNLTPIENACEKVQKLTGYEFDWNDNQDVYKGHDIGVVAQEVEEVLPDIVKTRDTGYKAVDYEKLVAVLIEANKELQDRVQTLEDKIDGLTK